MTTNTATKRPRWVFTNRRIEDSRFRVALYPRSKVIKNHNIPSESYRKKRQYEQLKIKFDSPIFICKKLCMDNDLANELRSKFESYLCELIHEIHTEPKAEEKQKLVDVEELARVSGS